MKKIHFAFLIFLFAKNISAQQYHPMLDSVNHWQTLTNYIPVRLQSPSTASAPCSYPVYYGNDLEHYTTQDTVINSLTYKIVDDVPDQNATPCNFGFIREDTAAKKVFFMDNLGNPEILLYDFSMQIGNTIAINFTASGYFHSGTYTLDSINTIHINAGFRRIFYLNNHAFVNSPTLPWVESVGSLYNPFYPYCMNSAGSYTFYGCHEFRHDASEFLTCFDHLSKVYYDSCAYHSALADFCFNVQDTCDYHDVCGSVPEMQSSVSMTIFPNPSLGKTTLSLDVKQKGNFEIRVWDISGKKMLKDIPLGKIETGKKDVELDLSSLPNGFYLVELKNDGNSVYRKLLIQH